MMTHQRRPSAVVAWLVLAACLALPSPASGRARAGNAVPTATPATEPVGVPRELRLVVSVPRTEVYLHEALPVDITLRVPAIRARFARSLLAATQRSAPERADLGGQLARERMVRWCILAGAGCES